MKKKEDLTVYGGQIIQKCTLEHFEPPQWLHGSPYFYLVEYNRRYQGSDDDLLYGLWKFNTETLKYELYDTADKASYRALSDLASKWDSDMWDERLRKQKEEEDAYLN